MSKKWINLDQVYFPRGVRSVYFQGRRISKRDIQIDQNFREIMSEKYSLKKLPDHIDYLPRKKAAEYLNVSESTLIRYHLDGKLKWITRRNRTPIYIREELDAYKKKSCSVKELS
jgi:hypothetical protein